MQWLPLDLENLQNVIEAAKILSTTESRLDVLGKVAFVISINDSLLICLLKSIMQALDRKLL